MWLHVYIKKKKSHTYSEKEKCDMDNPPRNMNFLNDKHKNYPINDMSYHDIST